jgi:hypothetical protein
MRYALDDQHPNGDCWWRTILAAATLIEEIAGSEAWGSSAGMTDHLRAASAGR